MKLDKILFIIGTVLVSFGIVFILAGSILTKMGNEKLGDTFLTISAIIGVVSLGVLIVRLVLMSRGMNNAFPQDSKVSVKIVDVKDIPKTREQELYEQYEELYKKNLITKEDLDKKREELLGKN